MAGLLDAILGMSGQERTEALRQLGRDLEYYVPPELRGILGFLAEMTPTATLERAAQAGGEMLAPDRTAMERLGSAGQMLSETAGVAAPMMVAGRAAMPAAQAIQEGLLGFSVAADDVGRRVVERLNQPGPVPTMYSNPVGRAAGDFNVTRKDASNIFGEGSERVRYTDAKSGGTMEVVVRPDGSASVLELEVPEASRGKGIGQALQQRVMQDFPVMGGQVSSKAAAKTAYRLGRRPYGQPDATLEDVFRMIDEDSSVNLISPQAQPSILPAPRNEAEAMAKQVLEMRAADDAPKGILAYHGSPHDFDRFSMSKIGTGEGAQAYGHGLYFASEADVARGYRRRLENATVKGRPVYKLYDSISSRADRLPPKAAEAEYNKMAVLEDLMNDGDVLAVRERASSGAYDQDAMDWFEKEIAPNFKGSGSLYEVNIKANPEDFLDWDKPLANSPAMKKAILNAIEQARLSGGGEGFDRGLDLFERDISGYTQGLAYRRLGDILDPVTGKEDVAASEALRGQGVAGIRYLDAMSRDAGEGSRNYVVFDENLIEIVRKYGIAGAALMLGMSQADLAQAMQEQQQQQPQGLLGGTQ